MQVGLEVLQRKIPTGYSFQICLVVGNLSTHMVAQPISSASQLNQPTFLLQTQGNSRHSPVNQPTKLQRCHSMSTPRLTQDEKTPLKCAYKSFLEVLENFGGAEVEFYIWCLHLLEIARVTLPVPTSFCA